MELGNELEVEEGSVGFIPDDCGRTKCCRGRTKWNKLSQLSFYQSFGG